MAGWTSMRQYEPSSIPAESLKFELELYFFCPRFPLSYREPISFLDDRRLWEERMSHFSTETLLDFARGLLPSPKADEVNHHLEDCKKCRESYDKWRAVMEVGRGKRNIGPAKVRCSVRKRRLAYVKCGDSLGKRRKLDIGDGPNPQRRQARSTG